MVPLEVLRESPRSMAEMSSLRLVAEDAGVSRSTVHNFITAGTTPQPRCRRLLALWCLRRLKGVDELELIRPYVSALDVLLADVPAASLRNVTLTLLRGITEGFSAEDEEAPRWLDVVRRRRVGWVLGDNDERLNALEEESGSTGLRTHTAGDDDARTPRNA